MNKRILELAKSVDPTAWGQQHPDDDAWCVKFAELIIQDVLKEVRDEVQYITDFDTADRVVASIKKHFGVTA